MRLTLRKRSGFAVTMAMCLIAITGVAMLAVGSLLAADLRRTLNGEADAELRQMLIAAEIDAPAHLSNRAIEKWRTPLPPTLAAIGRVETRRVGSPDGERLIATASLGDRSLSEQLRFDRAAEGWGLTEAQLFPAATRR